MITEPSCVLCFFVFNRFEPSCVFLMGTCALWFEWLKFSTCHVQCCFRMTITIIKYSLIIKKLIV